MTAPTAPTKGEEVMLLQWLSDDFNQLREILNNIVLLI
jgi:hypothetical protein